MAPAALRALREGSKMASDQPLNWLDDDQLTSGPGRPRYALVGEENGTWSVYDHITGLPAILDEEMLVEMTFDQADNMLELMNKIEKDLERKPNAPR